MQKRRKKKRILVVDDELQVCTIIKKVLEHEGYRVFTALSADAALELLKKSAVDLVLADLKMPIKDGLKLIREARLIHKNLRSILLTAYGTAAVARDALALGIYDFLAKPFDNQLLRKVVKETLRAIF